MAAGRVTRFGKISPLWQHFKYLAIFKGSVLYLAKIAYFGQRYAIKQIFIVKMTKSLKII